MGTTTLRASVRLMEEHVAIGQQEESHTVLLDRPRATGGTELGMNGGHLMLLGWGGCFKSNLVAAADARDIPIRRLVLRLEGDTATQPGRFESLRMFVSLDVASEDDVRQKLVDIASNSCIVSNTLKRAANMDIVLE